MSLIYLFSATLLLAKNDSGKNLNLLGDSASSLGRGGTGVSVPGADIFYLNPASIGSAERIEFGLQYGSLDLTYNNPDISLAVPTSYGVIGGSYRMMLIPRESANDIEKGHSFSIGGAKNFTENLVIGAALNFFAGSDPAGSLLYSGFGLGLIYKINFDAEIAKGFGIFDPRIGASVNAGLPFGENKDFADFNQATLGYNFIFIKTKNFYTRFLNDFSAINGYNDFPVKFGFETVIKDSFIVRAGFTVPQSYDYGDYSMGVGYLFKTENFDGDINYSVVHYSKWDFVHYLGLNIRYGRLDREPPVTEIRISQQYISPNYDGKQDYLIFNTDVKDSSRIKGWKLQILNSDNRIVKEYRISERDVDESLSLKGFFMKIWQKKESMVVPENILWDGTDSERNIVPDGKYFYSFVVWDERDNISIAKTGTVFVDNTAPGAILESENLFSPNGDNKKDSLEIKQEIITSPGDEWEAGFINSNGVIVKSYKWTGGSVPKKVIWDGKDDNNNEAAEGLYTYFIESTDRAGNYTRVEKRQITLTRKYQVADITCSHEYFSNNVDKLIIFFPYLSDSQGLEEWKIIIMDDDTDIIREITGTGPLPENVRWTPEYTSGKKLKDGRYLFKFSTRFNSGNTPESFTKEFVIDSTPPELDLSYSPAIFSPDGDGENDILTIYPEAEDKSGIREWTLDIYAPSGKIFKSFSGKTNPPGMIKWDGIGKDKDIVESAADYFLVLSASDPAGNSAKTGRIKVPVDILVLVTERGLKIRISNIEFAFDKAELTDKAFPILNRVVEILNKYRRYNVLIEGHTDDIGQEEYNLKLSEERARTVMEYLISKGIDAKRLNFRGMGEVSPFLPNTDKENRRRNRRVEFLLLKETLNN